jgi:hypothetical protein
MKYKMGIMLQSFNEKLTKRIDMIKLKKGYRIVLYTKFMDKWKLSVSKETIYKKYAERRFIEFLERK